MKVMHAGRKVRVIEAEGADLGEGYVVPNTTPHLTKDRRTKARPYSGVTIKLAGCREPLWAFTTDRIEVIS